MSRSMMRKTLKFFHTAAACGLVGALLGYAVLLAYAPQQTAHQYADMRQTIDVLCNVILLPSLAVALISGLLSMAVHTPFQEMRWVWIKALLGLGMFESTLAIIQSKAHTASRVVGCQYRARCMAPCTAAAVSRHDRGNGRRAGERLSSFHLSRAFLCGSARC